MFRDYGLVEILLFATLRCNLACKYCYVYEITARRGLRSTGLDMSFEVAEKAIELLFRSARGKHVVIWLFGGEPTVHERFEDFLKHIYGYAREMSRETGIGFSIGITTNGVRFADKSFTALAVKYINKFTVSLDGVREHHDKYRVMPNGRGSWEYVVEGVKNLVEHNATIQVNSEYTPDTVGYLSRDLIFLDELTRGRSYIATEFVYEANWREEDYWLLEKELDKAVDYAVEVLDRECRIIQWNVLEHTAHVYFGGSPPRYERCGLGQGVVAVTPDGRIYPCQRAVFRDKPIGDVWRGFYEARYQLWRSYDRVKLFDKYNCWKCPYSVGCMLGCLYVNYDVTGDKYTPAPQQCRIRKIWVKYGAKYYMSAKEHRCEEKVEKWLRSLKLEPGPQLCP